MQEIRRLKPSTTYPTSFIRTHMPRVVRQIRHDVVASAAGCRIDEPLGQCPVGPQVDQSHRTVLRLTQRHANLYITLSDGEGRGNAH